MNTAHQRLTHVVTLIAILAAAVLALASGSPEPTAASTASAARPVIELPRVVVTGTRAAAQAMEVVQFPRVVVTGRRMTDADPAVAQGAQVRSVKPVASAQASASRG